MIVIKKYLTEVRYTLPTCLDHFKIKMIKFISYKSYNIIFSNRLNHTFAKFFGISITFLQYLLKLPDSINHLIIHLQLDSFLNP